MTSSTATRSRQRPMSPHLTVYRWPITMTMSILHRVTGGALYFGTLLVAWWLISAAVSPQWFATADAAMRSWFGLLVLAGFTLALFMHALGGLRHLIWDTGRGLEKHVSAGLAWASLAGSIVLAVLFWAVFLLG